MIKFAYSNAAKHYTDVKAKDAVKWKRFELARLRVSSLNNGDIFYNAGHTLWDNDNNTRIGYNRIYCFISKAEIKSTFVNKGKTDEEGNIVYPDKSQTYLKFSSKGKDSLDMFKEEILSRIAALIGDMEIMANLKVISGIGGKYGDFAIEVPHTVDVDGNLWPLMKANKWKALKEVDDLVAVLEFTGVQWKKNHNILKFCWKTKWLSSPSLKSIPE